MFGACVALTCGVAVVVWVLGRRAEAETENTCR